MECLIHFLPFLSHLQTVALWLKNTNYKKHHPFCTGLVQVAASVVKLFQWKKVHEILWGYKDPFLEHLSIKIPGCPVPQGLSAFVQLQVGTCRTVLSLITLRTLHNKALHKVMSPKNCISQI